MLLNTLGEEREIILFDNAGVGRRTGEVPKTFLGWVSDMVAFIKALELEQVDLFGFSMGGLAGKYYLPTHHLAETNHILSLGGCTGCP